MKIYVAGGSGERHVAAGYMARLKAAGIELTFDWNAEIENRGGSANQGLSKELRKKLALVDVAAVDAADIFWLIVPEGPSAGCWFEFGAAYVLATRTRHRFDQLTVYVSGDVEKSLFCELADECFSTHEQAFNKIVSLAPKCKGCGSLDIAGAYTIGVYAGVGEDLPVTPARCRKCGVEFAP